MNCLGEHQEKTQDLRTWDSFFARKVAVHKTEVILEWEDTAPKPCCAKRAVEEDAKTRWTFIQGLVDLKVETKTAFTVKVEKN